MNTGGPAFPGPHWSDGETGMTLLDWYAGQALTGLVSESGRYDSAGAASDAYSFASAMLAEKARREATDKDSLTVQTREFDDDQWAKFQDSFRISFQPTIGWRAEIREGSLGSGNTIAEAVANLRTMWEERSAAPVVQESSTTDHSPDATKMIELQAANRELLSALEIIHATLSASGTGLTWRSVHTLVGIASTILSKHKGAA